MVILVTMSSGTLINKTPHEVTFTKKNGELVTLPPILPPIRAEIDTMEEMKTEGDIKVYNPPTYKDIQGPISNVIVSKEAAMNLAKDPANSDVYYPNTNPGHCTRDATGKIKSVDSLIAFRAE